MKNTKAQLQKTAKELNRRFGLNPPIDINCDLAHLEVEISKRIYGLMWPIAKGNLPNVLFDLIANGQAHSPNEN